MSLNGLCNGILIGGLSCVIARLVLIEHGSRYSLLIIKLLISPEIGGLKRQLSPRRGDSRVALIGLLHCVSGIYHH